MVCADYKIGGVDGIDDEGYLVASGCKLRGVGRGGG